MLFYLDENQSPRTAAIARRLGLDVLTTEEAGRKGTSDAEQLAFAAKHGRVVVTRDNRDFTRFTVRFMQEELPHAGVLVVSGSFGQDDHAAIARALKRYADEHPNGMPDYMIDYLRRVRD